MRLGLAMGEEVSFAATCASTARRVQSDKILGVRMLRD